MRSWTGLLWFLSACFSLILSLSALAYPVTVTDASGYAVTLSHKPERIASKTLFSDEVLSELIDSERFSSVTPHIDDPNFTLSAGKIDSAVPRLDLNVEAVLINRPDIVFVANWSDAGKVAQLRSVGIPVFLLPTPDSLIMIEEQILLLGKMVGEQDRAQHLVETMRLRLKEGLKTPHQRYRVVDYNSWGSSSTRQSSWQLILDQAGLENAVADLQADEYGQTTMSKELLVALDPDVMFVPQWSYREGGQATEFARQVRNDPALQGIKAIKENRVYSMPENLRGTYSHHIVDAILYVNHQVTGDKSQ